MFNCGQFRKLIVQPVLKAIDLYSPEAEELLIGTCAQESHGGTFLFQVINKPIIDVEASPYAIGIYQMEKATHDDIWKYFLPGHKDLSNKLLDFCKIEAPTADMMIYNLYYATAMSRVFYRRIAEAIPADLKGQAEYYKKHYNTNAGAATIREYVLNYYNFNGIKE